MATSGGCAPYRISKGVSLRQPGVLRTRNKAKGRRTVQSVTPVSKDNLSHGLF